MMTGTTQIDWPMGERDIKMLKELATTDAKILHRKYFPDSEQADHAFDAWVRRIANRIKRFQWYLNNVYNITNQSPYIKKRLIVPEERNFEDNLYEIDRTSEV